MAARAINEFNLPSELGLSSRVRMIPLISTNTMMNILVEKILKILVDIDFLLKVISCSGYLKTDQLCTYNYVFYRLSVSPSYQVPGPVPHYRSSCL